MNPADDRAVLLERCAKGDSVALRALYDDVAPQLLGVILRILQRRDLAEETLQEVFLSIWRNATKYRSSRGSPMAWLASIARNRALDVRRSLRSEPTSTTSVTDLEETVAGDSDDPEQETELSVETQRLDRCMQQLSPEQNRAIRLAFIDGLSYPEIASHIQTPLGTVKSWIRRGLLSLKACLQ